GPRAHRQAALQRVSPPTGDRVAGWRRACPDDLGPPAWPPEASLRLASLYKNVSSWGESWINPFGKARRGLGKTGGDRSGHSGNLPYHNRNYYCSGVFPITCKLVTYQASM